MVTNIVRFSLIRSESIIVSLIRNIPSFLRRSYLFKLYTCCSSPFFDGVTQAHHLGSPRNQETSLPARRRSCHRRNAAYSARSRTGCRAIGFGVCAIRGRRMAQTISHRPCCDGGLLGPARHRHHQLISPADCGILLSADTVRSVGTPFRVGPAQAAIRTRQGVLLDSVHKRILQR